MDYEFKNTEQFEQLYNEDNDPQESHLVVNAIKTPDGTIVESLHQHHFQCHTDENGFEYCVDGGTAYLRRSMQEGAPKYEDYSVYDTDDFEVIRQRFSRGGRGVNGDEPLRYVALADMNDGWLQATIEYICKQSSVPKAMRFPKLPTYRPILALYDREQQYRKEKGIQVD